MKSLLCTVFLLVVLMLVSNARGQEYENDGGTSSAGNDGNSDGGSNDVPWWTRLFITVKKFISDILSLFEEFRAQFEEKTKGIVVWTEEMLAGLKKEMNEWIDEYDYATEEEKGKMRLFIERLRMPQESEELDEEDEDEDY